MQVGGSNRSSAAAASRPGRRVSVRGSHSESNGTIPLDFVVERIMIEGDDIDVFVHWQGLWKKDLEDPGLRQRGHTRLQWVGTQSILLRGVQGDVPFGMKARQATIDPTRSSKKK